MVKGTGTTGSDRGTNGARRKLSIILAAGFLLVLVAITIGNAESQISNFAADGVAETRTHVWIWEVSSVLAWLSLTPLIWWVVARIRPPRFAWPVVAVAAVAGMPIASTLHIGVMIGLRHLTYAAMGETYRFEGGLADPFLYEFRKDIGTYLQFAGLAALAQWLLSRVGLSQQSPDATLSASASPRTITIVDGARRHLVPVGTVEHVIAAGNYVEVHAEGRLLLHRATLASIENELGDGFVRIHRSRIVNRAAIRSVESDRSGDFSVELTNGTMLAGSRRFRDRL